MNKFIALIVGIVLAASGLTLAPAANADTTTPPSGPVNVDTIPDVVNSMTKITSSVYNEQSLTENVTAELIQSGEAEIGPDGKTKDGRIAVAYEQTDVKSMKLKKVLKRCVKITHNVKQLRKAMKTKKFQKYGLVCFKKGVKLVERFKTKTGYMWIKMPPVWGKWRIAKHEGKALRAQGTWFSKTQLRNSRVRNHLINELNVSPADIDEAIAAGGGWFLMCGNKLALVRVKAVHYRKAKMFKAFLQQEAEHLYRLTKQVTSLGGAKAEGEQPCGPAYVRGEANSMLFSTVHSTIEVSASSEQEAKIKGAGRLTATLELAMTARNNITSKLTQWGQVSIVMECKYTPQPPPEPADNLPSMQCHAAQHVWVGEDPMVAVFDLTDPDGTPVSFDKLEVSGPIEVLLTEDTNIDGGKRRTLTIRAGWIPEGTEQAYSLKLFGSSGGKQTSCLAQGTVKNNDTGWKVYQQWSTELDARYTR